MANLTGGNIASNLKDTKNNITNDIRNIKSNDIVANSEYNSDDVNDDLFQSNATNFGYVQGYLEVDENGILKQPKTINKDGTLQIIGNKDQTTTFNQDYAYDLEQHNIRQTDAEETFLYNTDDYEDPTYLGFEVLFLSNESPLFNYDNGNIGVKNSALQFIQKYSNIPEIAQREKILILFLQSLKDIFSISMDSSLGHKNTKNKKHYVETIIGLEKLNNKMVEYEKNLITITLTEDVSLRTYYLAELYNNLIYSYKNQRKLIPDNCLRFDMIIKINDIRAFKFHTNNQNKVIDTKTYIMYKLHDCNFDFVESQSHKQAITMAGQSKFDTAANNLNLKISYKSISKTFSSNLIDENYARIIKNKSEDIFRAGKIDPAIFFTNKSNKELKKNENNFFNKKIKNIMLKLL